MSKNFLDFTGLSLYDSKIKTWLKNSINSNVQILNTPVELIGYTANSELNWEEEGIPINLHEKPTIEVTYKLSPPSDVLMRETIVTILDLGFSDSPDSDMFPTVVPEKTSIRFYSALEEVVEYVNNIGSFPVISGDMTGNINLMLGNDGQLFCMHNLDAELYYIGFITFRITGNGI